MAIEAVGELGVDCFLEGFGECILDFLVFVGAVVSEKCLRTDESAEVDSVVLDAVEAVRQLDDRAVLSDSVRAEVADDGGGNWCAVGEC